MSVEHSPEYELKKLFALGTLQRPEGAFQVALEIFGTDTSRALRASSQWPSDPEVLELKDKLLADHGERAFMPSKEQLARKVMEFADERLPSGVFRHDGKDRVAALRLYGDIMGFIEKPGIAIDNRQGPFVHNVLVVKDFGTDEAWENAALDNQERLTRESAN
jgi:hypothetical protein